MNPTITDTHVYFYGSIYSNWYLTSGQFTISHLLEKPILVNCSEEAFMYYKALFFNDHETCGAIVEHIMQEGHPANVKKMGRAVKNYDEKLWNLTKFGFMAYVCYCKFSQNPKLKQQLLDTGNRILVEASPTDCIWGVGLGEEDPLILDENNWRGLNLLGQALMDVRIQLSNE